MFQKKGRPEVVLIVLPSYEWLWFSSPSLPPTNDYDLSEGETNYSHYILRCELIASSSVSIFHHTEGAHFSSSRGSFLLIIKISSFFISSSFILIITFSSLFKAPLEPLVTIWCRGFQRLSQLLSRRPFEVRIFIAMPCYTSLHF